MLEGTELEMPELFETNIISNAGLTVSTVIHIGASFLKVGMRTQ